MTLFARAVAGALSIVLLGAVGYLGAQWALGEFDEKTIVHVTLGDLGQGIVEGSDVKIRGVPVGEIGEIRLDGDLNAVAQLELEPEIAVPERSMYAVTAKTLLGEKQIEIEFDGAWDDGPFLANGALVDDPERVVEFQDVLATLSDLLDAVDTDDLAVLVQDGLGAFDGQGDAIARSIDQGARATDVFARSLDDQVAGLHDLSLVAETLGREGATFNRMATELIDGLPTISDNQQPGRELLDELSRFSSTLNATLTVDRESIDRLMIEGDSVTRMLFAYRPEVGELVTGLVDYTEKLAPEGFTSPGHTGEAARFIAFINVGLAEICEEEGFDELLPACGGDGSPFRSGANGTSANGGGEESVDVPVGTVPVPPEVTAPQPESEPDGIDSLAGRALGADR